MEGKLNALEMQGLQAALMGDAPWLAALRLQVPFLKVVSRSYTGAGGYTDVIASGTVQPSTIPADDKNYPPVALVEHPSLTHGGAFIVWTKSGVIHLLETNADGDGTWPVGRESNIEEFKFTNARIPDANR